MMQGKHVSMLVDNGETHKFLDAQMVDRRGMHTESFEGFSIFLLGDRTM